MPIAALSNFSRSHLCCLLVAVLPLLIVAKEVAAQPSATPAPQWRRTSYGWERSEHWTSVETQELIAPRPHNAPHPALVAWVVGTVAIVALLLPANHSTVWRGPERRRPLRRATDRQPATLVS